jgi:hypothetical protein
MCLALFAPLARVFAPVLKKNKFGARRRKMKSEYRIQDGGRPGTGMPNILEE